MIPEQQDDDTSKGGVELSRTPLAGSGKLWSGMLALLLCVVTLVGAFTVSAYYSSCTGKYNSRPLDNMSKEQREMIEDLGRIFRGKPEIREAGR